MNKIFINARFLTQEVTGVQRFAIEISKQLKQIAPAGQICFVSPPNILHKGLSSELEAIVVGKHTGHLWEQLDLMQFLRSQGNPVLINLANSAPILYGNNVVTIHDLAVFHNPKWFSLPYRTYYRFLTPRIIESSRLVFTVSKAVKGEILSKFDLPKRKVQVIYNAVSGSFKRSDFQRPATKAKYVLTVSSLDPRKNLRNLILGFTQAEVTDHDLYIIGGKSAAYASTDLERIIQNDNRIKLLGRVSDEDLPGLYSNAKLFAYLSFYEGFGLPNIEAMAMGTPVLTSDIAAAKEVCGGAAFYTNPNNINDIATTISNLLKAPALLEEYSNKGLSKCREYSWTNSATKLYDAITKL
ncbi:glycosyltransferase family 4 protein [Pontibacter anaerobius]|uniref:Glycosyltransferase family 1 protein n=1 Tax=Pontibacter anaerobius TaxID=2993940 RepID=A0ABT3RJK0_9BACT|nr:glycosyltransferase family 1 protein [Pontibacter anaerobius]MCX2741549.1 glycosyltransferase family 1 protein [Pontibacter anaerobius]